MVGMCAIVATLLGLIIVLYLMPPFAGIWHQLPLYVANIGMPLLPSFLLVSLKTEKVPSKSRYDHRARVVAPPGVYRHFMGNPQCQGALRKQSLFGMKEKAASVSHSSKAWQVAWGRGQDPWLMSGIPMKNHQSWAG